MTIPANVLLDAISRRLTIQVKSSKGVYGGYIKFLPETESEEFTFSRGILIDGGFWASSVYKSTDFIDVEFADDISLSVYIGVNDRCGLYAYDADKRPVKLLVGQSDGALLHIVPDGSYKYVVAADYITYWESPVLSIHRSQE